VICEWSLLELIHSKEFGSRDSRGCGPGKEGLKIYTEDRQKERRVEQLKGLGVT